jgi:hypothetical protein
MILTPIPREQLATALNRFMAGLNQPLARAVFQRIRTTSADRAFGVEAKQHRRAALEVARGVGMASHPEGTLCRFNWDGVALNAATEAYVILHEAAHFALAPPERRGLIEFGLGPGPDTIERDAAERAAVVSPVAARRRCCIRGITATSATRSLRKISRAAIRLRSKGDSFGIGRRKRRCPRVSLAPPRGLGSVMRSYCWWRTGGVLQFADNDDDPIESSTCRAPRRLRANNAEADLIERWVTLQPRAVQRRLSFCYPFVFRSGGDAILSAQAVDEHGLDRLVTYSSLVGLSVRPG